MEKIKTILFYVGVILIALGVFFGVVCLASYVTMLLLNLPLDAVGATFKVKFWPMVGIYTLLAIIAFCWMYFKQDVKDYYIKLKMKRDTPVEQAKETLVEEVPVVEESKKVRKPRKKKTVTKE